jgi:hypothetical protein
MRLLKQRRSFTAQIVSTITVMDKSTKSLFRVKYPTKKDRPCGTVTSRSHENLGCLKARKKTAHAALLNLPVSRETWLSESPEKLGCLKASESAKKLGCLKAPATPPDTPGGA